MIKIHHTYGLESNYFWIIQPDTKHNDVYLVDPGDGELIHRYLMDHHLEPKGILITHRHHDHTGGIELLVNQWAVPVIGPKSEHIPQITQYMKDGESITIGSLTLSIFWVPGHTDEHIAYFYQGTHESPPLLFSGDVIFSGGCGRVMDTYPPRTLWESLQRIAQLPDNTIIYCSHEYTLSNLEFAAPRLNN